MTRTRERSMESIVESSNQSAFMKNVKNLNTEFVNNIEHQKKIFTQRNFFQFEIMKDIVFEKQSIFIRNRTTDRDERAKKRKRKKKRKRNRDRDRNRERKNRNADS